MQAPNRRLLQILGLGWLAFIGTGWGLRQTIQGPSTVVVIDRSYCAPDQWQQVADAYSDLYDQAQNRQLQIKQVILLNDLGEEVRQSPPAPTEIQSLNTFGLADPARVQELAEQFPSTKVLTCQPPSP